MCARHFGRGLFTASGYPNRRSCGALLGPIKAVMGTAFCRSHARYGEVLDRLPTACMFILSGESLLPFLCARSNKELKVKVCLYRSGMPFSCGIVVVELAQFDW